MTTAATKSESGTSARRKKRHSAKGRIITDLHHGGHAVAPGTARPGQEGSRDALLEPEAHTKFVYLFPELAAQFQAKHQVSGDSATVVVALKQLAEALIDAAPTPGDTLLSTDNSTIPAVYTYWGQFIDHDLTAATDRDFPGETGSLTPAGGLQPLAPDIVLGKLKNMRHPALNLDSVYADGPTFPGGLTTEAAAHFDGIELKVGRCAEQNDDGTALNPGADVEPAGDLDRDLPRVDLKATIGDDRNDENLIIAQLHTAFLRFHNRAVAWVREHEPYTDDKAVYERARQLTQWHYQWLTVHDYLKTVTRPGAADTVLLGGNSVFHKDPAGPCMPVEFSVAAFRFGHSMIRAVYDYNLNFGRPTGAAPFFLLFAFTGNGQFFNKTTVLPKNWIIDWSRFVKKNPPFADHFARRIDTKLAPPVLDMRNQGNDEPDPDIKKMLKHLAMRNLFRGYLLSIPSGQAVAGALGITALTPEQLQQGNAPAVNDALAQAELLTETPLWYYVLKEAEVQQQGNSLGELGSRLICETIIGQVRYDDESYLNAAAAWSPADGVRLPNGNLVVTIPDFLKFAGLLVD